MYGPMGNLSGAWGLHRDPEKERRIRRLSEGGVVVILFLRGDKKKQGGYSGLILEI